LGDEAISRLSESQIEDLVRLYQEEWWTKGRTREDVRRMLANTDFIVGFCDSGSGRLTAFARVLTDRVYKALIFDVIVAPDHRSRDLGTKLMRAVLEHPELRGVKHFELYCLPELVPFYEKLRFSQNLGGVRLMRRIEMDGPIRRSPDAPTEI
jgi:ribosomal protein S18 acetylase RimI-like enzyme